MQRFTLLSLHDMSDINKDMLVLSNFNLPVVALMLIETTVKDEILSFVAKFKKIRLAGYKVLPK